MLRELSDQYRLEDANLAPYAIKNSCSQGRRYPEEPHPFRTDFQRDRDRVLHSRAFRRLEYKTQVFLNGAGDHYRTRLTHTIEVAAVARTIARALNLNEDLAETIALAHDLGHTPFGHAGERRMNTLMEADGGFDHNLQALRVVDELEIKYPGYDGLNLSWEVRAGLLKHRDTHPVLLDGKTLPPFPSLEAQVADLADDLTYYGHDVDDGIDAGLIDQDMLMTLPIWRRAVEKALAANLEPGSERFMAYSVRCLIDMMVGDAIRNSHRLLCQAQVNTLEEVQYRSGKLISSSPDFVELTRELHDFLFDNVYFHPDVLQVNHATADRLQFLFETYLAEPGRLGENARRRAGTIGLKRAVTDYLAGMTDRFALIEYRRCRGEEGEPTHVLDREI